MASHKKSETETPFSICSFNPQTSSWLDFSSINYFELDYTDETHLILDHCYRFLGRKNNLPGHLTPKYLEYLNLLNELDDKFVICFESLLSNKNLLNSSYHEADLNLLLEVTDSNIFLDLYSLMTDPISLASPYHLHDVTIISQTENELNRRLLLKKATNTDSLNSPNHEYDMSYISKLSSSKIDAKIYDQIYYYLFNSNGINSSEHIVALEKLAKGEMYKPSNTIDEYLDTLEPPLLSPDYGTEKFITNSTIQKEKILTRIKKIFTHKK